MSYSTYRVLYNLLKHKYGVAESASYMEAVETMKKNGITDEELDALHETWGEIVEEPGL
jgi:hypothetical protein